jgi:hypothetical protein
MAFTDFTASLPRYTRLFLPQQSAFKARYFMLAALSGSTVVAAVALVSEGETVAGWNQAADNVLRFSFFLFLVAYVARPVARLFPSLGWRFSVSDYQKLILSFATAFGVSLLCSLAPRYLPFGAPIAHTLPSTTIAFGVAGAVMLIAILVSAQRNIPDFVRRLLDRTVLFYFWSLFGLAAFDHFSGPHRPDGFYGLSLLLLVAGLLLRFADAFLNEIRGVRPA